MTQRKINIVGYTSTGAAFLPNKSSTPHNAVGKMPPLLNQNSGGNFMNMPYTPIDGMTIKKIKGSYQQATNWGVAMTVSQNQQLNQESTFSESMP